MPQDHGGWMSAIPEPSPGTPQVRASYLKQVLESIDRLTDGASSRIRERLGPALTVVEGATKVDWLPHDVPLAYLAAVMAEGGQERLRAVYLSAMRAALRGTLLGPLFSAITGLFGRTPERILRSAPSGFASIWRNAGAITVESSAKGCVVLLHSGVPEVLRVPAFLAATAASFEAIPAECGLAARSEVLLGGTGAARYAIRWGDDARGSAR
jgi:hypothetical protein